MKYMKRKTIILMIGMFVITLCGTIGLLMIATKNNKDTKEYIYRTYDERDTINFYFEGSRFLLGDITEYNEAGHPVKDYYETGLLKEIDENKYELLNTYRFINMQEAKRYFKFYDGKLYYMNGEIYNLETNEKDSFLNERISNFHALSIEEVTTNYIILRGKTRKENNEIIGISYKCNLKTKECVALSE